MKKKTEKYNSRIKTIVKVTDDLVKDKANPVFSLNRSKIPTEFSVIRDQDQVINLWIKKMFIQAFSKEEMILLISDSTSLQPNQITAYIDQAEKEFVTGISQPLENNKVKYEKLLFAGLKMCLELKNMPSYFKGMELLADLYGIDKSLVLKHQREDNIQVFNKEFIDAKTIEVDLEIAEESDKAGD